MKSQQGFILSPQNLLDKLLVVCPNTDYCEEVLPRSHLQTHLAQRCKSIQCNNKISSCVGVASTGVQGVTPAKGSGIGPDVVEGVVSTIDIQRGSYDLGVSIVGGSDTPLGCILIQDIYPDGVIYKDGRLQTGDYLLQINGHNLCKATHLEARSILRQLSCACRLTVYREPRDLRISNFNEEIKEITLNKSNEEQLGIKLVSKTCYTGLYVMSLIPGGVAYSDSQLMLDDQIIRINDIDMKEETQDKAAQVIQCCGDRVHFVVSRLRFASSIHPHHPELLQGKQNHSQPNRDYCKHKETHHRQTTINKAKHKVVTIIKNPSDTLGLSVAGGYGSTRGDIPLYITNIQPHGSTGENTHIKKGDIILSINSTSVQGLCHNEAVSTLKMASQSSSVTLHTIEGPDTCDGITNFCPSWRFWLSMPTSCYPVRTVRVQRAHSGSLGFSITGGYDSPRGCEDLYIKSVLPSSQACLEAQLKSGDLLLAVNGQSLYHVTRCHAVRLLIGPERHVILKVVTWPGSLV